MRNRGIKKGQVTIFIIRDFNSKINKKEFIYIFANE